MFHLYIILLNIFWFPSETLLTLSQETVSFKSDYWVMEQHSETVPRGSTITYHQIVQSKSIIILTSIQPDGSKKTNYYRYTSSYKENGEFIWVCDDEEVLEIWYSPEFKTIGYDMYDRLSVYYYNIESVDI